MDNCLEPLRQVCHQREEGGLRYAISQYCGESWETRETVEMKLAFLRGLQSALANLRVVVPILPGSPLAQAEIREGLIADEDQLIRPTFYLADAVRD